MVFATLFLIYIGEAFLRLKLSKNVFVHDFVDCMLEKGMGGKLDGNSISNRRKIIANAVDENTKNVHAVEAKLKKTMFRELQNQ